LETEAELVKRERVLTGLKNMVLKWVRDTCYKKEYPAAVAEAAGGKLYTSGSYRLGIHEPGADIDTVCVTPSVCDKEDFFGELKEQLQKHPDVTNLNSIETAAVPVITFDWEDVNIDLLFAKLNVISVPDSLDIDNDLILRGVDRPTATTLNGPRVTNMLANLMQGTKERYAAFLTVIRCVRRWAKKRGLYSNKMGYWGGININILAAFTVQIYPNASPSNLLQKFFMILRHWKWPDPIMLTKTHDSHLGQIVWTSQGNKEHFPILTPAYPSMNSSMSISKQSRIIIQEEIKRADAICTKMIKGKEAKSTENNDGHMWAELFEPSDFFISYPHYLAIVITGPTKSDLQSWSGYVVSRLRMLV
ncbi:hypothetical protein TL16_g04491, partial [Triparma laevis f. inornata]